MKFNLSLEVTQFEDVQIAQLLRINGDDLPV
jgi:hypothetical protein